VTDCVFCEILATGEARWVAQEADAVAFAPLPGGQLAPGHTLVVPRTHCLGVLDAPPDDLSATMGLVQRVSRAMESALDAGGVVVLNASGPETGQSVPHLHFHVVPCWSDDQATFWPADRSAHEIAGPVHERLAGALASPSA
jgi:histidine triad (HIT) family protein